MSLAVISMHYLIDEEGMVIWISTLRYQARNLAVLPNKEELLGCDKTLSV
jgi:hypothetical protein